MLQWQLSDEDVQMVRMGMLILVLQPLATSLRTHRAGAGLQTASHSERERCLYSLMGPFAEKSQDEIPLFNSRLRTIIAVSTPLYMLCCTLLFTPKLNTYRGWPKLTRFDPIDPFDPSKDCG